jgi:hypothetical protein
VRNKKVYSAAAGSVMMLGALAYAGGGTAVAGSAEDDRRVHVAGRLNTLNNSGASGHAEVHVRHRRLNVGVDVRNVVKGQPHAMHIHYGNTARNECPTVGQDDTNGTGDFRIETVEGVPAYGPVRSSLTTRGNTGPKSVLAVTRFPSAPQGMIHYDRHVKTGSKVARGIRQGEAVVVVHGVDYNGNGKYDFRGGGKSDLNPDLPAEATDPVACGVLHR